MVNYSTLQLKLYFISFSALTPTIVIKGKFNLFINTFEYITNCGGTKFHIQAEIVHFTCIIIVATVYTMILLILY